MKKRFLAMCTVLVMAAGSLTGCGGSSHAVSIPKIDVEDASTVEKKVFDFDANGYAKVAANGKYELSIDNTFNALQIKQVSTGAVWSSVIPNAKGDADKSLFKVSCYNTETQNTSTTHLFSSRMKAVNNYAILDEEKNQIGIRTEYEGKDVPIGVTVDIILTDSGIEVKLPASTVKEEEEFKIISVDVLSNFAAAMNSSKGYYMYPDGSGAIMEFQDDSHHNENNVEYKIYGDIQTYKNMLGEWDEEGEDVFLPIFGANIDGKSFLGIIKSGEETASVNIQPKTDVAYNKMFCSFTYRNLFVDARKDKDGQDVEIQRYDEKYTDVERVVSYHLFEKGADITYADMAVEYRKYLVQELGVKAKEDKQIPVSMNVFMGINEEGTITDSFKTVTNFGQAEKMVDELKGKDVKDLEVQLKGWTENGYFTDPAQFPVNSDIGGNDGLVDFSKKYKDDEGVDVTLETNLLEAKADADGYDSNTEVVIAGNYKPISNSESTRYLLSPNVAAGNLNILIDDAKESGASIDGLSFYSLGQYIGYNYSSDNYITKSQCKKLWTDMLAKSEKEYKKVIVQGANQYAIPYADKLTDIPYEDSGYRMTTKSVPVLQIALHGLVNYTGNALNLSSDRVREKLKWVEYGYVPFFELTYKGSEDLMHTEYSELFSSTYSSWSDEVAQTYADFNKDLAGVWNQFIVDHEEVKEDVFKVSYAEPAEDGNVKEGSKITVVYVNYNDETCEVDGNEILANSYLVK